MTNKPFVSIIVPIRNEANYIASCLNSILEQDYPADRIEILVADGMSTDHTRAIVRDFQNRHSNIHLVNNPNLIVPTAMNVAMTFARGDVIIRVDGHCIIAPNYIRNCVAHLAAGNVDGVGGPMETIGETALSETIAVAMSSRFGVGNSAFRTETGTTKLVDTIPFPAYSREIVERAGYYDEELVRNQDDEYNYRIRELGGKLLLADNVRSTYYSRDSLGKLWKQYFQYGLYKVRVFQKHPHQMSLRQFVPPAFVAALILFSIMALIVNTGLVLLGFVAASYLGANLLASLLTAARKGWRHFALLPVMFGILHVSYGAGFLAGLVIFMNRWLDKTGNVPQPQQVYSFEIAELSKANSAVLPKI